MAEGAERVAYRASPPMGYRESCEPNEDGWPIWKKRDGKPPCGNEACEEPYDEAEPAMALQCPSCDEPGCHACMPDGRGCLCPACLEATEEADGD